MFTRFMDMHSGGETKVPPYEYIYIEAPEQIARAVFESRFERNPAYITCHCCGEDYMTSEAESLEMATAYDRDCKISLEDYCKRPDVLVIYKDDIL